ncbi:heme/hemin ABC transporter substrate-binding protein [Brackiella oedipodis]|uniref:heme/hemin ABC transporter substrate-binding protein n=1 Tax=Brackiella oedipodis TaxID=124225 RepID=UPI001FE1109E|nr:ABC transporter substrate-binding protein [Brackiella oedipodis]
MSNVRACALVLKEQMSIMYKIFMRLGAAVFLSILSLSVLAQERVISLGGGVTELVYALGQEGLLVGDDITSLYPEAAQKLPSVGYFRQTPVEGVIALKPSLLLASEQAGPKDSLKKIAELGVEVQTVSDRPEIDSLYQRIQQIAEVLNVSDKGQALMSDIKQQLAQVEQLPAKTYKTAFILNFGAGLMAGGQHTAANTLMQMAGLKNIYSAQKGFKPISAESMLQLDPEVIVTTEMTIKNSGGLEKFKALPAFASTKAVKENRVIVMEELLALGIGPRVAQALKILKQIP